MMAEKTKINWCDATFNPWEGCSRVSPACDNCYAARELKRFGKNCFGSHSRRMMAESNWKKPLAWNRKAQREGRRISVFCGSHCDVFEDLDDLHEPRERLWDLILDTPNLDWLLLTKRPENIGHLIRHPALARYPHHDDWKLNNLFLGVTAETQYWLNCRMPLLAKWNKVPLFLSLEPLLESVDLGPWLMPDRCQSDNGSGDRCTMKAGHPGNHRVLEPTGGWRETDLKPQDSLIAGVIVGGESGPGAREMDRDWAGSIRDQCAAAEVKFFMKQMSGRTLKEREAIPEDLYIKELPWRKDGEK